MNKLFQAFLTGVFFTFILDFFLFLGIFLNYIKYYEIDLYYNILFADHQNIYIYLIFSFFIGWIIIYLNNNKISVIILGVLSALSLSTLIPSIGYDAGELMLMKKNMSYQDSRFTYHGDVYYDGREQITFYDNGLKKIILLDKKELKK